jgi:hypothetical protein
MSASVPDSALTTAQLLQLGGFSREFADDLDEALTTIAEESFETIEEDIDALEETVAEHTATIATILAGGGVEGIAVFDVTTFGATGDGTTNDSVGIRAAITALTTAGGGILFFPAGTYIVSRSGVNTFSIDLTCSNCIVLGVNGKSWLKHAAGQTSTPNAIFRITDQENVVVRDMGFNGNWGATVGVTDNNAGINHTDQVDPKNYGVQLRGNNNVLIENCKITQTYGDGIWIGTSALDYLVGTRNLKIINTTVDIAARNGISFAQRSEQVHVELYKATNVLVQAIDMEPVDQYIREVTITRCHLESWWNRENVDRDINAVLTIVGGKYLVPGVQTNVRNIRIENNILFGSCIIQACDDVVFENNRVICDWSGWGYAPVFVQMYCDGLTVRGNYIYDRTEMNPALVSTAHDASIIVQSYGSGTTNQAPLNVNVSNNKVFSRNGRIGIKISGTGGRGYGALAVQSVETGTAEDIAVTGVAPNQVWTLTDNDKAWTVNQWQGYRVRVGDAWASISFNTATVLTLFAPDLNKATTTPWSSPMGTAEDMPAAGAYEIANATGIVVVENNDIDCTDDGYGAGGVGIEVEAAIAGMRVRLERNRIKNAATSAVSVVTPDAARTILSLVLLDNLFIDDQNTPTCTVGVNFVATKYVTKLTMRGNDVDGVAALTGGLTAGVWQVGGGKATEWEGYGTPESVVTAPIGSRFYRLDGGASTTLYIKTSGVSNTGWTAK